ncbi:MAG: DUF799 family lipoprotein [Magnetococcales bacterium]|nr:DUF799 family lipoprotein [Magnetococcales bacterium]
MHALLLLMFVSALLLSGCQTITPLTKASSFPHMYDQQRPVTILMLPPINKTTAADAKELYATTVAEPVTQHGYYLFPPAVVFDLFRQDGIDDTETMINTPPRVFGQKFGADAILIVELTEWNTAYYILGGHVSVGFNMKLVSTHTGETIWERDTLQIVDTSGGNNSGGGLAGLLVKAVMAALQTSATDYIPIARQANQVALHALPHGKYHPRYNVDKNDEFLPITRPTTLGTSK